MANTLYPLGVQHFLQGDISWNANTIKVIGVATTGATPYTYSASHEHLSDVVAGSILAAAQTLASKTQTNGVANAANVTFPSVAAGATPIGALIIYQDTGTGATSDLIAYIDTATGLPVTPNGGNINVNWDTGANKIFAL